MDIEAYHQIYRDILVGEKFGGRRIPLQVDRGAQEGSNV